MKGFRCLLVGLTVALIAPAFGAQLVYAPMAHYALGSTHLQNKLLGSIDGQADHRIHILAIGIGGDANISSGNQIFKAVGGGLDFSWTAGQNRFGAPFTPTYTLQPTPLTQAPFGFGFTYLGVDLWADEGASLEVRWLGTADWDGCYTYGVDLKGTLFNDSAIPNSARGWILYELVRTPAAVPAPGALLSFALGFGLRRRLVRRA
ncbi:MAG TPA: hypothetical protein VM328_13330 [Fimbriimonadaceae bacterium]|nr:hypothetical protein [Fimbriimonadaceae bacterium]